MRRAEEEEEYHQRVTRERQAQDEEARKERERTTAKWEEKLARFTNICDAISMSLTHVIT